jgi:hypothetical protein
MGYSNRPKVAISVLERVAPGCHLPARNGLGPRHWPETLRQRQFRDPGPVTCTQRLAGRGERRDLRLTGGDVGKFASRVGCRAAFHNRARTPCSGCASITTLWSTLLSKAGQAVCRDGPATTSTAMSGLASQPRHRNRGARLKQNHALSRTPIARESAVA